MKHIKDFGNGALLGSMSVVVMAALTGCESQQSTQDAINENKFIIVKETTPGKYTVIEEQPISGPTRVMVQNSDGTMKELSPEEIKALAEQEYQKVQSGTSEATQEHHGEGMGLGSTILAVAAGSILGNMIANQLMGNKNFQRNNMASSARARSFNRSQSASKKSPAKSGFFGKSGSSTGGGFFGG